MLSLNNIDIADILKLLYVKKDLWLHLFPLFSLMSIVETNLNESYDSFFQVSAFPIILNPPAQYFEHVFKIPSGMEEKLSVISSYHQILHPLFSEFPFLVFTSGPRNSK